MLEKSKGSLSLKFPIILSVVYLFATIGIYIICPYDWPTKNPVLFYTLNVLYITALVLGYLVGQKYSFRVRLFSFINNKRQDILFQIVSYCTIINCIFYFIYILRDYGFQTLDIAGLFNDLMIGIKNPGVGYKLHVMRQATIDGTDVFGGQIFTLLNMAWAFVKNIIVVLSMLYYKKLNIVGKIFSVVYICLVAVFYLSIGTNIQIFHIFLLVELPAIMKFFKDWHTGGLRIKNITKFVACILAGLIAVACYFGYMMESRSVANGYEIDQYQIAGISPNKPAETTTAPAETTTAPAETTTAPAETTTAPAETTTTPAETTTTPTETTTSNIIEPTTEAPEEPGKLSIFISKVEKKLNNLWLSASSYLTQGYYGMSQALSVEWTPMYGFGSSMFIVNLITGNIKDIDQYTYQVKLEEFGWDSDVRWHSIYTWLANDVSFYGVILVMFIIGLAFGMLFKDAIINDSPFAKASMFFFILLLIFIPCNNQVAQSSDTMFPFIAVSILWLITGDKPVKEIFKRKAKQNILTQEASENE